jgi:wyosine [tRNA(Phe)-imidazoG37] synthetase (radical SAM superfamily)
MTSGVAIGGPATGAAERSSKTSEDEHPRGHELPIVFGPVRSRRLGWSLGINNVPPKTCSYACIYCQVGATTRARARREAYLDPTVIDRAVQERVRACRSSGQAIDFATFVPDGEPTLDVHLGEAIRAIRGPDLRVAVLTNASLLWREDVREDLAAADWVSLKVDTVDERTWRQLNRPVRRLDLAVVLAGVRRFAEEFHGYLATETMLVSGVNDDEESARSVAGFVRSLDPSHAYVSVPVRPSTVPWARPPLADVALKAADAFAGTGLPTTLLRSDQAEAGFAPSPDAIEGLIGILAVHPMTERAARDYVTRAGGEWRRVEELIDEGAIVRVERGLTPYLRVDLARLGLTDGARPISAGVGRG